MRVIPFIASALATSGLIYALNTSHNLGGAKTPHFGAFLSPQHGYLQNAEKAEEDFNATIKFPQLNGKVSVYMDHRLVPHIFAEQENDAYFIQGYLHAKFRLWQMELQALSAAGRASEVVGIKALNHDREFRRQGMVYAAEIALKEIEKDPVTKAECDAYTAGANAYISTLTAATLPLEYKLLNYKPEPWSNLKTALFLKYMSYDLAGHDNDFEMTNARSFFSPEDFDKLYPAIQDSLDPIIPKGTPFLKQTIFPKAPLNADSTYFKTSFVAVNKNEQPDRNNGSNNWAVSGKKTASGAPILCNDPHLGINLPSLWYEVQISTPDFNAYGVSFPGAPGVVIGFNDSCAFGFTNGGRDVKDYYEITFKDDSRKEYLFNGTYHATIFRYDTIKIKDAADFIDTVAYVQLGNTVCPVMFDKSYTGGLTSGKKHYALRWTAHDPSNDLKIFNRLNRAKNYADYLDATANLYTPGQNCVFACKNGDIALRTQGGWPAKWKGQGDYIMPGADSSYLWQGIIPNSEVPYQYNPERGFISSANQKPVDESYPYYLGRNYPQFRGWQINRRLSAMSNITPRDMMQLQTDNYNAFAATTLPALLKHINESALTADEKKYLDTLKAWNYRNDVGTTGATVFTRVWNKFTGIVYDDEFAKAPSVIMRPFESSLMDGILRDTAYSFLDNITTSQKETLADDVTAALKSATVELNELSAAGKLQWEKFKATHVDHLTKLPAFSRLNLPIGGGAHVINATLPTHAPSWRMVVHLSQQTEAYGVYPGGQSGNPGSKFYDVFINDWAAGKYYTLWMMKEAEAKDDRIKWVMNFSKD
jgi:penicillin G amidase